MLSYWGGLLADAAHHKRNIDLTEHPVGLSTKIVPKRKFFPISGYGALIRNIDELELPKDCLVDDAYISYLIYNLGYRISYAPEAKVLVKYPKTLSDYFLQKKRSVGGYIQLWNYGVVKPETKTRSFWRELEYAWFPIKYAQSLQQLVWSLMMYPTRFWLWLQIYWERKFNEKEFNETWVRIESTK
jgi:cellulose synthase/poly-beta-1,6-N-acetylglucosamine synthase-like glycosyltransferase